jgi:hypothetical protein
MKDERVLAYRYDGTRYDCGSKLGYLKATTAMGLKHAETGSEYCQFLRDMQCLIEGGANDSARDTEDGRPAPAAGGRAGDGVRHAGHAHADRRHVRHHARG